LRRGRVYFTWGYFIQAEILIIFLLAELEPERILCCEVAPEDTVAWIITGV